MMSLPEKIEKLVYSGMVIDDHGKWISIAEKLRKEKKFLSHLERGEILIDGKWTSLKKTGKKDSIPPVHQGNMGGEAVVQEETTLDPPESPEETVFLTANAENSRKEQSSTPDDLFIETPEETVAISTDSIRDLHSNTPDTKLSDAEEFPPETQSLFVELVPPPPETTQSLMTEFEETVLYNIKVLKDTSPAGDSPSDSTKKPVADPNPQVAPLHDLMSPDDPPLKHPPPTGTILIVIAAIIIIAAIVFKLFLQ